MNVNYIVKNGSLFAQAYGTESYGSQVYSDCEVNGTECTPITYAAPNTGFLGLSQDAAVPVVSGALLVTIAIVGTLAVMISRQRALKKAYQAKIAENTEE